MSTTDREELPATLPASSTAPAPVDAALPDLLALADTERLQLGDLVGRGGMGEVWACRDQHLGRELAFKTVTAHDDTARARFVREARVQGQLEHPGVVPVHELGVRDARPYFTMKRVRGVTLAEVIRRLQEDDAATCARYTRHRLLSVMQSLAQTIDFAHARGVVHRDVKPGNVMLGDFGEVYLLDWGIAKLSAVEAVEQDSAEKVTEPGTTLAGAVLGTPGYMAPEQAGAEVATGASDVWAMAAILYEALTLSPLVRGSSNLELMINARSTDFPPLSAHPRANDVPPELDALCTRALSRDPIARPTARQFVEGLDAVLSGQRDLQLRADLAAQHAQMAQAAAQRALEQGENLEARAEALREIGQALALQPGQPLAKQTFLALMQAPPAVEPASVTEALAHLRDRLATTGSTNGLRGYLAIAPFLGFAVWMGVRDGWLLAAMSLAWAWLVGASWWAARHPPPSATTRLMVLLGTLALGIAQSWVLGPFMVIPGLATANAIGLMIWVHPHEQRRVLVLTSLTMVVPLALQGLGLIEPFYVFEQGRLVVMPHALHFDPTATLVMLTLAGVGTMWLAAVSMMSARKALEDAQRQLALQRWTLAQLGGGS